MTECRILTLAPDFPAAGPGWRTLSPGADLAAAARQADALLLPGNARLPADRLALAGLPWLVWLDGGASNPALLDAADGFIMADDDVAAQAAVIASVRPSATNGVADGGSRLPLQQISALSAEAARIAEALAALADAARPSPDDAPVTAPLVRRLIRLRQDRARFFPAEIFADPAWDMLLDLIAARMENAQVPVSSLCVAANVPTTTALRWIRSLTEAGLFERRIDPADGRRSYIALGDSAAQGMLAWARRFNAVFALRD